jgi:hypothetical protein
VPVFAEAIQLNIPSLHLAYRQSAFGSMTVIIPNLRLQYILNP